MTGPPANPFTNGQNVSQDNTADWYYDQTTGEIRAVLPATKAIELDFSAEDYVAAP